MKKKQYKKQLLLVFVFIFFILLPWTNGSFNNSIEAEKVTSDLSFYQIYPCKVSVFEFFQNNINVLYQDHYFLRVNNYSSISCFGKISGVTQVGYNFYISIGTNVLVNLILQSLF